jgi:WD40 repeat protein
MATAQLMPQIFFKATDSNGNPLAGGQLFSYAAGTSTLQATYTDQTATTPNPNPTTLDSTGSAQIWFRTDLAYKLVLQDASNNVLWTKDVMNIVNPGTIDKTKIAANVAGAGLLQNGGTQAIDVQVDGTSVGINGSNQLYIVAVTTATIAANSKLEVALQNVRDFSCPGLINVVPQFEWSTPTKLSNPGTLPAGSGQWARWSPNDEFLAVAHQTSPYVTIYQRSVASFTKLANPATLPAGNANILAWSPCGDFLAVGHATTPFVTIYQRTGNSFTKLANPATLPAGAVVGLQFSPNSDFLACISSGGLNLYERSGTTFTDITGASNITNPGTSGPICWSPDSSMLALIKSTDSSIQVWNRTDATFNSITAPNISSYLGNVVDMCFSPQGNYFSVALSVTPFVLNFQMTGQTFSAALSNPAQLPAGAAAAVSWSLNDEYLAVGHATSPFMTLYLASGATFTAQANPGSLPVAASTGIHFSPKKQFLATSTGTTPFVQIYQTASTLQSNALMWSRQVLNA